MRTLSPIIVAALATTSMYAQTVTLRDMAAHARKPIIKAIGSEETGKSMASLATKASLIVQGTLRPMNTYLSSDGTLIYTDFECTPITVIAGVTGTSRTPGAPSLIVRQVGGKLTLDGVEVTVVDEHLDLLPSNQPLVLLLEKIAGESKYRLSGDHWGAFSISSGAIAPLIKPAALQESYSGMRLDNFVEEIKRARAGQP
jgi:hypothetical protein